MRAAAAVAAASGRFTPSKPTVARNNSTSFVINNYDPTYQYVLTPSSGTASRSGSVVTLSAPNATCTVVAYPPKGVTGSTQSSYEVKAYTYTNTATYHDTTPSAYAADMARSTGTYCPWGGSYNGGGLCVFPSSGYYTYADVKDSTPSGYTDSGTEWFRTT